MYRSPVQALRRVSAPEIAVFVSGVASTGLEVFAGRIVAPEFDDGICAPNTGR